MNEQQVTDAGDTEPLVFSQRLRATYRRALAAFRFEMRRTRTASRLTAWGTLVLFPPGIMAIIRYNDPPLHDYTWGIVLYLLATQAATLLGLLLWVAPAVQVELEGRTWSYIAVRPRGKLAVLCGKYLNGMVWAVSSGVTGIGAAVIIGQPDVESKEKLFLVLMLLQILGSFAYGALYLAIGTLFPKRAMVFAVGYTLVFEVVVSFIPATINQLTVQHRLWNLLWNWMDWLPPPEIQQTLNDQSNELHLLILVGYTVALLIIAAVAIRMREYATAGEP